MAAYNIEIQFIWQHSVPQTLHYRQSSS